MIDWYEVFSNALWIFGCAVALAAVSYASWEASVRSERLRDSLGRPKFRLALSLAGVLFCLGLAATSHTAIEIVIWLILTALFVFQAIHDRRDLRRRAATSPPESPVDHQDRSP